MKKAILTLMVGLLLGSAGFVAGILYGSNRQTGTMNATASLILSGSPPSNYSVGNPVVFTESVQNALGSPLNVYLVLTLSETGMTGADVSILIAGNPITPVCSGGSCTFTGSSFVVNAGATVLCDVSLTFNATGSYGFMIQAWGS